MEPRPPDMRGLEIHGSLILKTSTCKGWEKRVGFSSQIVPALLPITTDFFPDARALALDYNFSEHSILVDDESIREVRVPLS